MQQVKNKKLTYLLLCAVAGVWGIILYKIFFKEKEDQDIFPSTAVKADHEPYDKYTVKTDTFKLVLNYRDPFLGTAAPASKTEKSDMPSVPVIKAPVVIPPPLNWSGIQYSGRIINPVSKRIVSILSVNGKERMMAEGEVFEGVKLLKNQRDSVLLSWQGKQKYIKQ